MPSGRKSDSEIECDLLWRLVRRHGWGNWVPEDDLIDIVPTHERGRARDLADDLQAEPYVAHDPNRGYAVNNSHVDLLADRLHNDCGYSKFRIETTLSHFDGFD